VGPESSGLREAVGRARVRDKKPRANGKSRTEGKKANDSERKVVKIVFVLLHLYPIHTPLSVDLSVLHPMVL
jgi:hypothetical protein